MKKLQIADCRLLIGLAIAGTSATLLAQAPRPQPGTKLPFDQIKAQMFHVSAGKRLKPKAWPNGARVAVGLSFDVDNATPNLATGVQVKAGRVVHEQLARDTRREFHPA